MANTLKFNVIFGSIAALLTFFVAWTANVWFVSLERAFYAFILFFLLGFPVHWAYRLLFGQADAESQQETVGQHIDMVADDQAEAKLEQNDDLVADFQPLTIPRLENQQNAPVEPAMIANIVRRFSDE